MRSSTVCACNNVQAVNYSHGKFGKAKHFSRRLIHEKVLLRLLFCKNVALARNIGLP